MSIDKSRRKKPDVHHKSQVNLLSGEDIAVLPNDESEECLLQDGCAEEEKLYKANPDFILRSIAGEFIAVPTGASAHNLNAVMVLTEGGAFLWKCLSRSPQTKADLTRALEERYDVEPETAFQDVSSFLEKAISEGVIYQV